MLYCEFAITAGPFVVDIRDTVFILNLYQSTCLFSVRLSVMIGQYTQYVLRHRVADYSHWAYTVVVAIFAVV